MHTTIDRATAHLQHGRWIDRFACNSIIFYRVAQEPVKVPHVQAPVTHVFQRNPLQPPAPPPQEERLLYMVTEAAFQGSELVLRLLDEDSVCCAAYILLSKVCFALPALLPVGLTRWTVCTSFVIVRFQGLFPRESKLLPVVLSVLHHRPRQLSGVLFRRCFVF